MDCNWRMPINDKEIIHGQTTGTTITVRKGMNILKFHMEISSRNQCFFRWNVMHFVEQLPHFFLYIFRGSTNFIPAGHIIMFLIFPGTLAQLIASRVIRVTSKTFMEIFDKSFIQRSLFLKSFQEELVCLFQIPDLKERPQIACI